MNEKSPSQSFVVKLLVIAGFVTFIVLLLWLGTVLIERLSPSFANLANVAETKHDYEPADELELAAEKTIVNSGESFEVSWTDMKQTGEYKFTYACANGVTILVRKEDGQLKPIRCNETLTLPATVHGLFVSAESEAARFVDVMLSIAFISTQKETTHVDELQVTVVNARVPVSPEIAGDADEEDQADTEPDEDTRPVPQPVPQAPVYTTVYPQSNPNGYVDLAVRIMGTGRVQGGAFLFTSALDGDGRNAIKFDVQNTGTKTSDEWEFEITLPDGETHRSKTQRGLKPLEHAQIVLEFVLDDEDNGSALIEIEIDTDDDTNSRNDDAVWKTRIR